MSIFKRIFYYAKLAVALIRLNRDPQRTHLVFVVSETLAKLGKFEEARRVVQSDESNRAVIEQRKTLHEVSLAKLSLLPEGTLGRTYSDHMLSQGLDPNFYPRPRQINDETFIFLRLRQTHDLFHVVTGFDTSPRGEIGLQSFQLAQTSSPLSVMLVASAILRCALWNQDRIFPLMDIVTQGWQMGRRARPLFSYDWDAAWSKDLSLVRQEMNVSEVPLTSDGR